VANYAVLVVDMVKGFFGADDIPAGAVPNVEARGLGLRVALHGEGLARGVLRALRLDEDAPGDEIFGHLPFLSVRRPGDEEPAHVPPEGPSDGAEGPPRNSREAGRCRGGCHCHC